MKVLRIADSEDHVSAAAVASSALRWIAEGSVLMVTRGMILDHTVPIALAMRPLTINQDMKGLVPRAGLRGDFLAWLLVGLNPAILARVEEAAHGTKALRTEQWKKLPLAIPPEPLQRGIAVSLDRKTAAIDELIAKKERLVELLAEKRQALITQAVTRGLDPNVPMKDSGVEWLSPIPTNWQVAKISHLGRVRNGSTPDRASFDYWDEGTVPWLSSGKVNDYVVTEADQFITEKALRECPLEIMPTNSVIVGMIGQGKTRGTTAITTIPACINQNVAAIVPGDRVLPWFLLHVLTAAYFPLREFGRGGQQDALNCQILGAFRIPLPRIDEQKSIVRWIEEKTARADRASLALERSIERLREYRQALTTAAVTGQLDVTTADSPTAVVDQEEVQIA